MTAEPGAEGTRTNLTITVDADVLRKARLRALREDTSVNAFLRGCLEEYADEGDKRCQGRGRRQGAHGRRRSSLGIQDLVA